MNFTQSNLNILSSKVNVSLDPIDPIKMKYSAMGNIGENSTKMVQLGFSGSEKSEKKTFYNKRQ